MIRDFWGIKKSRLVDEIQELQARVDSDTWAAIDGLRQIGNIGAHMEKDVDLIVEVEPDEAEKLLWLIELLAKEWYINRDERRRRLANLAAMAEEKAAIRKPANAGT